MGTMPFSPQIENVKFTLKEIKLKYKLHAFTFKNSKFNKKIVILNFQKVSSTFVNVAIKFGKFNLKLE